MRDRFVFICFFVFNLHVTSRFTVICKVKIKVKIRCAQLNHIYHFLFYFDCKSTKKIYKSIVICYKILQINKI